MQPPPPVSYYEDEEDEESLFEKMLRLRNMIAEIPAQSEIVSEQTRQTVNRLGAEISKVMPQRQTRTIRRIPQPELPVTAAPELPATAPPQLPTVATPQLPRKAPRVDSYGRFAGRRRKMPDTLSVFLGRRKK